MCGMFIYVRGGTDSDCPFPSSLFLMQAGMDHYRQNEGYEPSAEELIDVLKNLENLAAANPALYLAIVDQIKGK